MLLSDILTHDNVVDVFSGGDVDYSQVVVSDLAIDSRKCKENSLFAALKGEVVDGHDYIPQVLALGASVILLDAAFDVEVWSKDYPDVVFVLSEDVRNVLGRVCAQFYSHKPTYLLAVTGTNGKTSVAQFCHQLWALLDVKSAAMGTLGILTDDGYLPQDEILTTADVISLHENLASVAALGVTHVAMEASSHGLDQQRMAGVRTRVAAITNISRDHLDYHKTPEAYMAAKMRIFSDVLDAKGVAVLNADIPEYDIIAARCEILQKTVLSYGYHGEWLQLLSVKAVNGGQEVQMRCEDVEYTVILPLICEFQVYNVLCALVMICATDASLLVADVIALLPQLSAVKGRMEMVAEGIVVDYAHTPDGLEHALKAMRNHCIGRLMVLKISALHLA